EENAEWIVLINGRVWRVYHPPPDEEGGTGRPVGIIDVDLLDEDSYESNIDALFHITREAVENGRLEALRRWREALAPERLRSEENAEWIVRITGRVWRVYHLPPDEEGGTGRPVGIIDVDLLDEDSYESNIDALFHITREAVENGRLEALRRWREALAPERLGEALSSTAVLTTLRAELRAHTGHPGHEGDSEELLHALAEGVVAHGL